MPPTVEEAIAVLEEAAKTPRARAALSTLQEDIELADREASSQTSSGKPRFPDSNSVAEHFGDTDSARGSHSSESQGLATARKGT